MEVSNPHFDLTKFFARYLCGGGALREYRQVSRSQLALASCDIGYFEPKAASLAVQIDRFLNAVNHLLFNGLDKSTLCYANCFIRRVEINNEYRGTAVRIGKNKKKVKHGPPDEKELEQLMDDWFKRAKRNELTTESIFDLYSHFLFIHPFADGNGRTGRAILQYLFNKHSIANLPPDLYRIKNKAEGNFVSQIRSYANNNKARPQFFDDWICWDKEYQKKLEQSVTISSNILDTQLDRISLSQVQNDIIDITWHQPIVSVNLLQKKLALESKVVNENLITLKEQNILIEKRIKTVPGKTIFIAPFVLSLWQQLDESLFDN